MDVKKFLITSTSFVSQTEASGTFFRDSSPNIGTYYLTDEVMEAIDQDKSIMPKLISFIIEARLRGEKRSIVVYIDFPPDFPQKHNWAVSIDEVAGFYPASALEMFNRSLLNVSKLIKHPGEPVALKEATEYLLYGDTHERQDWLLRQLGNLGYIHLNDDADMNSLPSFTIEGPGWKHIDELQRKPNSSSNEAFVAMSFQDDMKPFFERGIKPAVEADLKTKCVRIDGVQHNNKICDEIVAAIRRSRYVVADFTGNRGGVYYEAGFAHGLGIPVIWTVKDSIDGLHFDTRQYNHIVYATIDELNQKLRDRIAATVT